MTEERRVGAWISDVRPDKTCVWCTDRVTWFNALRYVHPQYHNAIDVCRWCASSDMCRDYLQKMGYKRL